MKIKVCGMREPENISDVCALGIDYMGFIFYPPSPRNCLRRISERLLESLPSGVEPVAVTVNLGKTELLRIAEDYGFRAFQLHGDESPELCRLLRSNGMKVIKGFGISSAEDLIETERYAGCVDLYLFDTASSSYGGSGQKFNWRILDGYGMPEHFLLSGGIGPDDWKELAAFSHPCFEGVDLNSRFEVSPGLKDLVALEKFIEKIRL